jgi:phenylalanyl-tRNA synthetase alpha chain
MKEKIERLRKHLHEVKIESAEQLEAYRLEYLSKKGKIQELFGEFKNVAAEEKPLVGQWVNQLKNQAQELFDRVKDEFSNQNDQSEKKEDLSRPAFLPYQGARHPISLVRKEIIDIFNRIGFVISEGPEVEDDFHVFTALNFPPEHPARDMQDTFFIEKNPDFVLRTHTSSVQARVMQSQKPPIRTISPGRVFRNEAISARAHCIFHQVEGLYIDKNVSFADLKQTLLYFAQEMFGKDTQIRLRPSYFPFTEPSAEMDVSCNICGGKGCNVCKYTGWLEILGCGMVDPNVLTNCGIDAENYTGFAFGMGVERIAMLKYQVKDLRLFFENDKRFLNQFIGAY